MLTVVIPTHNNEHALLTTLAALVPGAAAGVVREVIVADGGSVDHTREIADIAGCEVIISSAPIGERLAVAAGRARAPWLLFLRPGIMPEPSWISEVVRFGEEAANHGLDDQYAAAFGHRSAAAMLRPPLIEVLRALRAMLGGRPRPEQGLLIAKRLYERLGGHAPGGGDAELALLRRLGRRRIVILGCRAAQAASE